MPAIKAKPVRLIDVLGTINEQEIVVITFNHGRNSCSNTVAFLEDEFKRDLSTAIKGMTCRGGAINIYI